MNNVYIALGSNISPRHSYLKQAIELLENHNEIKITNKSQIYETEPVGYTDQHSFLNMVIEAETSLEPLELLSYCQSVEKKLGRVREVKWGPRTIDLDILLYNQEKIKTEHLIVPHPRMHERSFVLIPLENINPSTIIPGIDKSVSTALEEMPVKDKKGVIKWTPMNGEE